MTASPTRRILLPFLAIVLLAACSGNGDAGCEEPVGVYESAMERSGELLVEVAVSDVDPAFVGESAAAAVALLNDASVAVARSPDCFSPEDRSALEEDMATWSAVME